jgi:hypothetical protein
VFINRFIGLLVALVTVLAPALVQHPASVRALTRASPTASITWNGIAQRAVLQVAGQAPTHALVSIGFVQAAVYDAVVAIEGGYQLSG